MGHSSDGHDPVVPPGAKQAGVETGMPVLRYAAPVYSYFRLYFWFVLKNVIGWILIISSWPVGIAIPGPGGIPLFLLGFALITFPGKRKLTSRIMRGRPMPLHSPSFVLIVTAISLLLTAGLMWLLQARLREWLHDTNEDIVLVILSCILGVAVTWVATWAGMRLLNSVLRNLPKARRYFRPWLRRKGIRLLPPRARHKGRHAIHSDSEQEIIRIDERHGHNLRYLWAVGKPWLLRLLRIAIVVGIFTWMLRPIYLRWEDVKEPIMQTRWSLFALSAGMFAVFLFVFRVLVWRRILKGFGHHLPLAAATRIWSFSELARYLPGAIWQVVGRAYLIKPYGVNGAVSSAAQLLEITLFLLANVLLAVGCLLIAGAHHTGRAEDRKWLLIAIGFVPLLLLLLHPPIFFGLLNAVMKKLKKPTIAPALRKRHLLMLLSWNLIGLLFWQSLAIWILAGDALQLRLGQWWILAGVYSLAWTMGFAVAFLAPSGIGVREFVFVMTLSIIMPRDWVAGQFENEQVFRAFLAFLGVLLRLWTIGGELIMAAIAYLADLRGALGDPRAPGRVLLTSRINGLEIQDQQKSDPAGQHKA